MSRVPPFLSFLIGPAGLLSLARMIDSEGSRGKTDQREEERSLCQEVIVSDLTPFVSSHFTLILVFPTKLSSHCEVKEEDGASRARSDGRERVSGPE